MSSVLHLLTLLVQGSFIWFEAGDSTVPLARTKLRPKVFKKYHNSSHILLLIALVRYDSHAIRFNLLKCTSQRFYL